MLLELARWLQSLENFFGLFGYLTFRGILAAHDRDIHRLLFFGRLFRLRLFLGFGMVAVEDV